MLASQLKQSLVTHFVPLISMGFLKQVPPDR